MDRKLVKFRSYIATKNFECVYVWLAKERDTEASCCYVFNAEVYESCPEAGMHLKPCTSKSGMVEVSKFDGSGKVINSADRTGHSIGTRIIFELKGLWGSQEFPNSKFLAFCNIES